MKCTSILAIAAASLFATQAYASGPVDIPIVIVAPPAPVSDWTGFYAGISLHTGSASFNFPAPSIDYSGAGLFAGYLYDTGSFVVGAELNAERNRVSTFPINFTRTGVDLIAGYDAGNVMPFVTLGGARLTAGGGGGLSFNGAAVSIGVNVKATENVIISGKYRQTRYNMGGGARMNAGAFVIGAAYQF